MSRGHEAILLANHKGAKAVSYQQRLKAAHHALTTQDAHAEV